MKYDLWGHIMTILRYKGLHNIFKLSDLMILLKP